MKSSRLIARAGVLVSVPVLAGASFVFPAAARPLSLRLATAAACSAAGCNGLRPELTTCDKDGRTIRTGQVIDSSGKSVGTVELRWSPSCKTNWARVTSKVGGQPLMATLTRADSKTVSSGFRGTSTWSPMLAGQDHFATATGWIGKASGAVSDGPPSPGDRFD